VIAEEGDHEHVGLRIVGESVLFVVSAEEVELWGWGADFDRGDVSGLGSKRQGKKQSEESLHGECEIRDQ
jgi:hypothetical protein